MMNIIPLITTNTDICEDFGGLMTMTMENYLVLIAYSVI